MGSICPTSCLCPLIGHWESLWVLSSAAGEARWPVTSPTGIFGESAVPTGTFGRPARRAGLTRGEDGEAGAARGAQRSSSASCQAQAPEEEVLSARLHKAQCTLCICAHCVFVHCVFVHTECTLCICASYFVPGRPPARCTASLPLNKRARLTKTTSSLQQAIQQSVKAS